MNQKIEESYFGFSKIATGAARELTVKVAAFLKN